MPYACGAYYIVRVHICIIYIIALYACALGKKPGVLRSILGCRDPVSYTGIILVKTGWLVDMALYSLLYSRVYSTHHSETPVPRDMWLVIE